MTRQRNKSLVGGTPITPLPTSITEFSAASPSSLPETPGSPLRCRMSALPALPIFANAAATHPAPARPGWDSRGSAEYAKGHNGPARQCAYRACRCCGRRHCERRSTARELCSRSPRTKQRPLFWRRGPVAAQSGPPVHPLQNRAPPALILRDLAVPAHRVGPVGFPAPFRRRSQPVRGRLPARSKRSMAVQRTVQMISCSRNVRSKRSLF